MSNKTFVSTPKQFIDLIMGYEPRRILSLDIETRGKTFLTTSITDISFYDGKRQVYIDLERVGPTSNNLLKEFFESLPKSTKLLAWNIPFDFSHLKQKGINVNWFPNWVDPMVACHLLDSDSKKSLKYQAESNLYVTSEEYDGSLKDKNYDKWVEYCLNDSLWAYELWVNHYEPRLEPMGLDKLFYALEMPYQRVLVEMKTEGIMVNKEDLLKASQEVKEEIHRLNIELHDTVNEPYELQFDLHGESWVVSNLNLNSTQQLASIIENKLGLEIPFKTNSGKPSTGKQTLNRLKGKHKFVDLLISFKELTKLSNSFLETLPTFIDVDGRIRPTFLDVGTTTGRLSAFEPNLQQLPAEGGRVSVRKFLVAPQGYSMIACDYSGQELRVLAHISDEESMIQAFKDGADFHQATADRFGVSRSEAKTINFGIAYGKSSFGFAQDFETSEEEAQRMLNNYFSNFPNIKKAIDITTEEVKRKGFVTNLVGRIRKFRHNHNGYYPNKAFRQAFNFKIQGSSADMIRAASLKTYKLSKVNPEWDLKQVATVHDENIYIVKDSYKNIALEEIQKCFEEAANLKVPMLCDAKAGKSYAECK